MVSYTDLSPLKQPDAPVAVDLNDPVAPQPLQQQTTPTRGNGRQTKGGRGTPDQMQIDEWRRGWECMHSRMLYFWGVTENSLAELQQLFKACRGIRLNVDPHDSIYISGNVEFRNVYDTEKAMAVLNRRRLNDNNGTLVMSPLPDAEIEQPPNGSYVCVKHIPEEASEATLFDFLRPVGPLYSCSIPMHPGGQRKNFAHAWFVDGADANEAIEQLNFTEYLGNTVSIHPSRPPRTSMSPAGAGSVSRSPAPSAGPVTPTKAPEQQQQQQQKMPGAPPSTQQQPPITPVAPPAPYQQASRRAASPGGASDGPGNGLGGVIVPGKLFITNLHPTVSHKELFALFKTYGYIQSARVSIDPATKKSRGHGIVQFSDPSSAIQALKECQGADIKGRKITMYQYEHVNKQSSASPRAIASPQGHESPRGTPYTPTPTAARAPSAASSPSASGAASAQGATPAQKPASSTPVVSDPLLDPVMLRNLTDSARNEILAQKLISEVASNPAVDVRDASRIVDSFLKRPLEDIIVLLSDPSLLASEWEIEQRASPAVSAAVSLSTSNGRAGQDAVESVTSKLQRSSVNEHPARAPTPASAPAPAPAPARAPAYASSAANAAAPAAAAAAAVDNKKESAGGIHLHGYDTETEEYIEMLLSKPENERKKKLGSKLFPLIKGMGYKESTKLTVWILDHMSQDVRSLAYTLNDRARLRDVVNEALRSI